MRVIGDGFFAFSPQALFLPTPRRFTDGTDPIGEGIQAIKTPYVRPESTKDGWWRVAVDVWLHPGDNRPKLVMSAPGMRAREGWIDVRAAELHYHRSLTSLGAWGKSVLRDVRAALKKRLSHQEL